MDDIYLILMFTMFLWISLFLTFDGYRKDVFIGSVSIKVEKDRELY